MQLFYISVRLHVVHRSFYLCFTRFGHYCEGGTVCICVYYCIEPTDVYWIEITHVLMVYLFVAWDVYKSISKCPWDRWFKHLCNEHCILFPPYIQFKSLVQFCQVSLYFEPVVYQFQCVNLHVINIYVVLLYLFRNCFVWILCFRISSLFYSWDHFMMCIKNNLKTVLECI